MEIIILFLIAGLFFSIRAIVLRRHTGCGVVGLISILLIISAPFIYLFLSTMPMEFDKSRNGNPVLVASEKHAASCSINLYLYKNGKFRYFTFCFGLQESTTGEYQIIGDSISFINTSKDFSKYAIYNREEKYLLFYRSESDTISSMKAPMPVIIDEFKE